MQPPKLRPPEYVRFLSHDATNIPQEGGNKELMLAAELESVMSHVSIEQDEIRQDSKRRFRMRAVSQEDPLGAYLNGYCASKRIGAKKERQNRQQMFDTAHTFGKVTTVRGG